MAAIMAAIGRYEEEMASATPAPPRSRPGVSQWKYSGLGDMMRMRVMCQLRLCSPALSRRS